MNKYFFFFLNLFIYHLQYYTRSILPSIISSYLNNLSQRQPPHMPLELLHLIYN